MKKGPKTTVVVQVEDLSDILSDPKLLTTIPPAAIEELKLAKQIADEFIALSKEPEPSIRDLNLTKYKAKYSQAIAKDFVLISTYIYNATQKSLQYTQQNEPTLLAAYSTLNILHSFLKNFIPLASQDENTQTARTAFLSLLFSQTSRANAWLIKEFGPGKLTKSNYWMWYQAICEKIEWLEAYGREYQELLLQNLNEDGSEKCPTWHNMTSLLDFYKSSILFCSSLKLDDQATRLYTTLKALGEKLTTICNKHEHPASAAVKKLTLSLGEPPLVLNDLILTFFRQLDNFLNLLERNVLRISECDQATLQTQCQETSLSLSRLTHESSRNDTISLFGSMLQHLVSYHAIPSNQRQKETIKTLLKEWLQASLILKMSELVDKDFICYMLETMFQKVINTAKQDLLPHSKAEQRKAELDALEEQFKAMVLAPLETDQAQEVAHQEKIAQLKLAHQQALQEQRTLLNEQSKALQEKRAQEQAEELASLKAKHTAALLKEKGDLLSKRDEYISKLDKKFSRSTHQLEQAHTAEITKINEQHEIEKQRLEKEHQIKVAAAQSQSASKRQSLEQDQQAELASFRTVLRQQHQQKAKEHQKKLQAYKTELDIQLNLKKAELEEQLQRTLLQLEEQQSLELAQIKAEFDTAEQALEVQFKQLAITKSAQKNETHLQAQHQAQTAHQAKIVILKKKLGWRTEVVELAPFSQIALPEEVKYILSLLDENECFITGQTVLNQLVGRLMPNELIEVIVNASVQQLRAKLRGHGTALEGYPQVVRLGNIVFNCVQEPTLKQALSKRPPSTAFICRPSTGEVFDVLRYKEQLCSIPQCYITEYIAKLSQLFLSPIGLDNFNLINRMGILQKLCPFLPENYYEILNNPHNGLYHFWSKIIFEFSMHPDHYTSYHVLSLFLVMALVVKPAQIKPETCLSRNIDKLFLLCPTSVPEADKVLIRNNLQRIILGGIEEANLGGGFYLQYQQCLTPLHAPVQLYTPGYDRHVQGVTLVEALEERQKSTPESQRKSKFN